MLFPILLWSQETANGTIWEANEKNETIGLPGANVYWLNTKVGTVTDFEGNFSLPYKKEYKQLVVSYVGFKTDTITVTNPKNITHSLQSTSNLKEVTVTARKQATAKSYLKAQNKSCLL